MPAHKSRPLKQLPSFDSEDEDKERESRRSTISSTTSTGRGREMCLATGTLNRRR